MAITDRTLLDAGESFDEWLDRLARAGVDAVQIREKDLSDRELVALVLRARKRLPSTVAVLVNGRLDIALAAGADGVHLPASGLPADSVRRWAGDRGAEVLIGRSTHSPDEVPTARTEGADYVTFGPVFPTPGKERYGPPPGPEALRRAAACGVPVLALGGVHGGVLETVARAGAAGAAGIRVFYDPEALTRLTAEARRLWGPW